MMQASPSNVVDSARRQKTFVLAFGLLAALVAVVNWEACAWLIDQWYNDVDYTYGFFVVPFSCLLLWDRREMLSEVEFEWSWLSIPFMLVGVLVAWYGAHEYIQVFIPFSMVLLLLGLALLLGGWKALRWSWSAILFLVFMVPLPGAVAGALRLQLQLIGTDVSVFTLQTLGMPAVAQGNVILLPNSEPLQVAEACSGIRMLMLFLAACIGAAFYLRRDLIVTRVLIVLSAIPIAIIANVFRITITAFLYEMVDADLARKVFHDLAGWIMMPVAIVILWAETAILARLFTVPRRDAPLAFGASPTAAADEAGSRSHSRGDGASR